MYFNLLRLTFYCCYTLKSMVVSIAWTAYYLLKIHASVFNLCVQQKARFFNAAFLFILATMEFIPAYAALSISTFLEKKIQL